MKYVPGNQARTDVARDGAGRHGRAAGGAAARPATARRPPTSAGTTPPPRTPRRPTCGLAAMPVRAWYIFTVQL